MNGVCNVITVFVIIYSKAPKCFGAFSFTSPPGEVGGGLYEENRN